MIVILMTSFFGWTKMKKYLKPIEIDYHLKYICTEQSCKNEHWLSCREAKVIGFKIVCDCDTIYSPLPVSNIKIYYKKAKKKTVDIVQNLEKSNIQQPQEKEEEPPETFEELQKRFIKVMSNLGFDDELEVLEILDRAYKIDSTHDVVKLFKIGVLQLGNLEK